MAHSMRPNPLGGIAGQAAGHVERAAHHASSWIELLARAGYAAKGVVYCMVGFFAILAALGTGSGPRGSKSALQSLMDEPFGQILLAIVGLGLAGYALWCFVRATLNPERDKITKRLFSFGKGLLHASLVLAVVGMIVGNATGGDDGARDWTAKVMAWPAGKWIAVAVGLGIALYGLKQVHRGWSADLDKQLSLVEVDPDVARGVRNAARFGIASRGVIFTIIGAFVTLAGWHANPGETKGVAEALAYLGTQPLGEFLLGITALGLIAYGVYEFARARYRHIKAA